MLKKGDISLKKKSEDQFLSTLFLVGKKDGGKRPVINLEELNKSIPYGYFKMDDLFLSKEMLLSGDLMCKINLKGACFPVPLAKNSQKYVRFHWKENPYEFLCLCFGLSLVSRIFKELMKISISILRKLCIRIIIYLDNHMLSMGATLMEL